ncbi:MULTISPECIES: tetratricopeptide repeat protein [Chryseobacterium]|uniref:Tetratricopeptide (TPR) repeat protein n=1 Tax=Chryseobacterium camelliae TaxID=1265445 RepID=A0ABU0TN98_9FLAO|nr:MULTISPECIES: tetratricopeptide repeat protein [Chryseobacterium]MDT3408367.1 tetratricopeptide (TPR) repeat protein [Pseudacidovorax intermedius]MDQ1097775.1 tetratricopeptide (TPR) repeat protein [Chryseobacterium camelliae]MDQ1101709.1 tetratricopeptide (TPR) repeat protein [Chryseobacterium sp. SORGH_AS_1048]MDR6085147.1 tetratricopeptide (TPR) repeat protein [Chryseobacterium sp. SORGH_AS_0909]MDR6129506.1 tetratricopeptide (TPR) repeat protein [Chryseobacterium sp. SORGH_AS_1175]
MKDIMNMSMNVKKIALGAAVVFFTGFASAQTLQDGIISIDSDKFAQAKTNFTDMVAKAPTAENYFYLGNTYLRQSEPDYAKATESFNKGLAADSKSYLNKIGLAAVKLGKGDKAAVAEIQKIVADSREKDAEVLFRAAEALTLFDKNNSPDLAIQYLNKAIERAKKDVPAYYYYTLGDAYRLKRVPGDAMTAYDKALPLAKNKASVYTRIGTLWMAAQQWQQAKTSIEKAIATDPTYAPAYKAMAAYDIRYQQNAKATQDLINYTKYADEDPYTQLEIAKLYFTNEDYTNSKAILDKIFDKIDDPIKFKLRAYQLYAEGKYAEAKQNMDNFVSKAEKSRIQPADQGLQGLIAAGLAKTETDAAKKTALTTEAQQKIAIAKAAKDETMKWDMELAKISGGVASQADVDAGPTNPTIEGLKQKVAANAQDTDSLFKLATAYQDAKNWNGAIQTWQKMNALLPDWAPGYYSLGYSYQQAGNNDAAKAAYEKFISTVKPADVEANKQTLAYAYFAVAYMNKDSDLAKAKDYVAKSVQLDPNYQDAVKLNAEINK